MDLSFFKPFFEVNQYMCAGVDGLISKIHLTAKAEGTLKTDFIGIPITIKPKKQQSAKDKNGQVIESYTGLIHEVKRVGLLIDRYIDLELRVGDQMVFYLSKS